MLGIIRRFSRFPWDANKHSEDTKQKSAAFFDEASENIRIIAGSLNADFYSDKRIVASLENAVKRGVRVCIAYCPALNPEGAQVGKAVQIKGVNSFPLEFPPRRHMMSIDNVHVRIEKRHGSCATSTPAIFLWNAPSRARDINAHFDALVREGKCATK